MNKDETIALGWCDNGTTDGAFTESLLSISLLRKNKPYSINTFVRVEGNQISRQRQTLIDYWYEKTSTDWLFWIDSDIFLTEHIWEKICETADKEKKPIVSGVYFICKEKDGSLPILLPCIFDDIDDFSVKYHHPLPHKKIIKIDSAGMGLVIIHRSVVYKLKKYYGEKYFLFGDNNQHSENFIGEDISFFRNCKKINIPVYANTEAIAQHIKRTYWDNNLYELYWNNKK